MLLPRGYYARYGRPFAVRPWPAFAAPAGAVQPLLVPNAARTVRWASTASGRSASGRPLKNSTCSQTAGRPFPKKSFGEKIKKILKLSFYRILWCSKHQKLKIYIFSCLGLAYLTRKAPKTKSVAAFFARFRYFKNGCNFLDS